MKKVIAICAALILALSITLTVSAASDKNEAKPLGDFDIGALLGDFDIGSLLGDFDISKILGGFDLGGMMDSLGGLGDSLGGSGGGKEEPSADEPTEPLDPDIDTDPDDEPLSGEPSDDEPSSDEPSDDEPSTDEPSTEVNPNTCA